MTTNSHPEGNAAAINVHLRANADFAAAMIGKDKLEAAAYFATQQPTPGAGEGERWHLTPVVWEHLGICTCTDGNHYSHNWRDSSTLLAALGADQQTIADLRTQVATLERSLALFTDEMDDSAGRMGVFGKGYQTRDDLLQTIADLRAETKRWQEFANGYANQTIAELRKALRALLRQTNNIEVLGEWSAEDRNHASQKKLRAEIDAVKAQALATIAATEEGKSS